MRYIYITTNLINGKRYLGQRKTPKGKTPQSDNYLGSGTLLLKAVKKYGKENFSKEIIHVCETQSEADTFEILEIDVRSVLNNKSKWYNRAAGGQYNRQEVHSKITSDAMKLYYSNDENYTKMMLEKNRRRYIAGLAPISNTTIANKDISTLKRILIKKNLNNSYKEKRNISRLIKKSYLNPNAYKEAAKRNWVDNRESMLESMRIGQKNRLSKLRANGDGYHSKEQKIKFALAKCKSSNNMLGQYIINNYNINYSIISNKIKKTINKKYKDNKNLLNQLERVREIVIKETSKDIQLSVMIDLTNESLVLRGI